MKKTNKTQKRERLILLLSLFVMTVLLCIPYTKDIFVGIFGYAIYAYIVALYGILICLLKGRKLALPKRKAALYIILFFSLILTLHIGLSKELVEGGWGSYIIDPFTFDTAGGMILSIVTAIIVVPIGYLPSLIIFFILTCSLAFFAVFPFLIKKDKLKGETEKKKFLDKLTGKKEESKTDSLKVMNIKDDSVTPPVSLEEFTEEPKPKTREDARKLLFGDTPKPVQMQNTRSAHTVEELNLKKPPVQEKKISDPYEILPNIQASLIKPRDEVYTNAFLQKSSNAKETLLSTTLAEDYKNRYGEEEKPKPVKKDVFTINPYVPEVKNEEKNTVNGNGYYEKTDIQEADEEEPVKPIYQTPAPISRPATIKQIYEAPAQKPVYQPVQPVKTLYNKPYTEVKKESIVEEQMKIEKLPYRAPTPNLLKDHRAEGFDPYLSDYEKYKEILETTLEDFGITATVETAIKGPTVTRYELKLAQGTGNSVNKVLNLHKDLKMVLEAEGEINILAPIRGKNAIGIEIPNKKRGIVSLKETICTDEFRSKRKGIQIALGKTIEGKPYIADLEDMPHLLVAGATGTGKSVCINTIITSILFQHSPEEVKLLLIDPKKVELINYVGLPHLLVKEPLVEIPEIVTALKWIREETSQRFNLFREMRVVNINAYNNYAKENGKEIIPKIVIVIDEASELMTKAKKEVEETLSSLARIGRAAGVHLIFATQSPTKDVITSEIQNNLNTKIAFAVSDYVHSQVIFKSNGAEKLLGKGDMFLKGSGGELIRIQCSYVDSEEIQAVVGYILQNNDSEFDQKIVDAIYKKETPLPLAVEMPSDNSKTDNEGFMESVKEALKLGLTMNRISTSLLQRKMEKGYNGAAKIIDYLEEKGYIGAPDSVNKKRDILITKEEFLNMYPEEREDMLGME